MAFAVGHRVIQEPVIDQAVTFHTLGNLQRAVDAADERADELEDQLINQLRDSLRLSQEENNTLQERLALEVGRVNVLENRVTALTAHHLEETRAFQDQINAFQQRAQADAAEIAALKISEEANKQTLAKQKIYCDHPLVKKFFGLG